MKMRQALRQGALIVLGLVLGVLVLEVGLRVWFSLGGAERQRMLYVYDSATLADQTAQLIGLPYLNYGLNPAWADVNTRGIRGPAVSIPKPDGVYRIVALGGSTTFGHGLAADESWPAQLQTQLHEAGYAQVEVVNLGVPGYFSLDSVVNLATHGLAHEPDLVLVYHGINDAIVRIFQDPQCYNSDTPLLGMGLDRGIWQPQTAALPPSTLYRLLALRLGWMADPTLFDTPLRHTGFCPPEPQGISPLEILAQNPPTHFARNMRTLAGMTQAAGGQMVFSTFAWDTATAAHALSQNPEYYQLQAQRDAIDEQNALLGEVATEQGALLVDLAGALEAGPYFQGDMIHQNAEGMRRQAEIYSTFLLEAGVLPPPIN